MALEVMVGGVYQREDGVIVFIVDYDGLDNFFDHVGDRYYQNGNCANHIQGAGMHLKEYLGKTYFITNGKTDQCPRDVIIPEASASRISFMTTADILNIAEYINKIELIVNKVGLAAEIKITELNGS